MVAIPTGNVADDGGAGFGSNYDSSLNDDFQCLCLGGIAEGFVGTEDVVELEAMRDQQLGVDFMRRDRLKEHRNRHRINQLRGDSNVTVPEAFQI